MTWMLNIAMKSWAQVPGLLLAGAAGGFLARALGAPMPFMIGSLTVIAALSIRRVSRGKPAFAFPQPLRKSFIAVIGVLIGQRFSPELAATLPRFWPSLLAIVPFVALAHATAYGIFRHVGGYDRATALFAAMPGGLIEAITIGERSGGKVEILTVQHFARIVLVVAIVPALFLLWSGQSVGSAAGQGVPGATMPLSDLGRIALMALVGIAIGTRLRLPASHLMGPMLVSASLHGFDLIETHSAGWLLSFAQLVVGVGLGALFADSAPRQLVVAFLLGALAVLAMLATGLLFALGLSLAVPGSAEALFISFAPGGVTEMSLIALSLHIDPVIVAAHHLFRISVTVSLVGLALRSGLLRLAGPKADGEG